MPTAWIKATIFASARKSSSCCINCRFGFGHENKSRGANPDTCGSKRLWTVVIGPGIGDKSEKISTFVTNIAGRSPFIFVTKVLIFSWQSNVEIWKGSRRDGWTSCISLCGVQSDCFRVFHDLTAADCSPYIFTIICYLCIVTKVRPHTAACSIRNRNGKLWSRNRRDRSNFVLSRRGVRLSVSWLFAVPDSFIRSPRFSFSHRKIPDTILWAISKTTHLFDY